MGYVTTFTRMHTLPDGPVFDADGYCLNWDGAYGAVWSAWDYETELKIDRTEHPSVYGDDAND